MKKSLLIILFSIPFLIHAQKLTRFGLGVGYGTGKILNISAGFHTNLNFYLGFYGGLQFPNGTKGDSYDGIINWDYYQEGIKIGHYYNILGCEMGWSYGKKKNYTIGLSLGYAHKYKYLNSYDNSNILSENGKYYVTKSEWYKIDSGMFFEYEPSTENPLSVFYKLSATVYSGLNGSIGLNFNL